MTVDILILLPSLTVTTQCLMSFLSFVQVILAAVGGTGTITTGCIQTGGPIIKKY